MIDFTRCVKHDGKTYCLDTAASVIVEIRERREMEVIQIPSDEVPREVLIAVLGLKE